jgi:hypothetical protein
VPVIRLAQQPVPGLVLKVVNAPRVRRRRQVRGREAAGDQLGEKPVRLPAVRDPCKRPILPRQAHPLRGVNYFCRLTTTISAGEGSAKGMLVAT